MTTEQHINERGLSIIKEFEGLRLRSYVCPAGKWTIGWGHTRTARPNMGITEGQADELLREDVRNFERCINRNVRVPLTNNEFSALVSWAFNIGCGAVQTSTLLRVLNQGNKTRAADELLRWNRGDGRVLKGLIRRRQAERELFLSHA